MRVAAGFLSIAILASASAAVRAEPTATIAIAPLVMSMPARPDKVALLGADGAVRDKASSRVLVKIVKNEIQTADGEWILRLAADGTVTTRMKQVDKRDGNVTKQSFSETVIGKLNAKDELHLHKGGRIWFDDKTSMIAADNQKDLPGFKFDQVTAKNRRAALLLFVSTLAPATMTSETKDAHGH